MKKKILTKKVFSLKDANNFSKISGDWNPIHHDLVIARRLIAGEIVLHGIASLLWAINYYLKENNPSISYIRCNFIHPITLDKEYFLTIEAESDYTADLVIFSDQQACLKASLKFLGTINTQNPRYKKPKILTPQEHTFNELKNSKGKIYPIYKNKELNDMYPNIYKNIGLMPLASIICLSRLVGMHCPGMNSLFSSFKLNIKNKDTKYQIDWNVSRHSIEIAPIKIYFDGGGLIGELEVFYRPEKVNQKNISSIKNEVKDNQFIDQNALIIGGSRGLGELVTKIVVAGGGKAIASYFNGKQDIKNLESNIKKNNLKIKSLKLDINDLTGLKNYLIKEEISHIYYFASPKIQPNKNKNINKEMYKKYCYYYVDQYSEILEILKEINVRKFKVFYPSTIFIDEKNSDYREYIESKKNGEQLSKKKVKESKNLKIIQSRLPRMLTDQTSGIVKSQTEDNFLIMLDIAKKMSHS